VILWLSAVGVAALIAVASWWKTRDREPSASDSSKDPDWGDWPSDQMSR
jgi:hypothetical protein